MSEVKVPSETWVVVCDGAKAVMFQNEGDAHLVNLRVREIMTQPNKPDRELGTDRPGRVQQSMTSGRSTMEETDWHERAEVEFLGEVAEKLGDIVQAGSARRIVLVAPPAALGVLRPKLSPAVQGVITAEVAKNYTNLPVDQIEKYLLQ